MQAAEQRIDGKIAELKSLEQDIGSLVDKRDEEEGQRLKSLVKIYTKKLKASPILASMDPAKARQVTLALAERRQQHGQRDAQVRSALAAVKP